MSEETKANNVYSTLSSSVGRRAAVLATIIIVGLAVWFLASSYNRAVLLIYISYFSPAIAVGGIVGWMAHSYRPWASVTGIILAIMVIALLGRDYVNSDQASPMAVIVVSGSELMGRLIAGPVLSSAAGAGVIERELRYVDLDYEPSAAGGAPVASAIMLPILLVGAVGRRRKDQSLEA